jgi:hypothetical protein
MKKRILFLLLLLLIWSVFIPETLAAAPSHEEMIDAVQKKSGAQDRQYIDLIIPRQKLGPFAFSLRQEEALQFLGEPDKIFYQNGVYTLKNLPARYYFLYNTLGISFFFKDGVLEEMTTFSPRYKFPNGIRVGSSEEKLIAAFGTAYRLIEGIAQDNIVYEQYGVSFRVSKQKRIVWEISISKPPDQNRTAVTFDDLLNREVPKLDLSKMTLADLVRIFGEPLSYRWGNKTFTRDNLPSFYVAAFRNHFTVLLQGNKIIELGFNQSGFKLGGILEVGSSLKEAIAMLGEPHETIQGVARNFENGVLYVNIAGEAGACYYERAELGVRLFFTDFKISALYLMEPQ